MTESFNPRDDEWNRISVEIANLYARILRIDGDENLKRSARLHFEEGFELLKQAIYGKESAPEPIQDGG